MVYEAGDPLVAGVGPRVRDAQLAVKPWRVFQRHLGDDGGRRTRPTKTQ